MSGKIFVNYRRDDVPGDARGVRDGLAAKFGKSSIFMDVDNLLVGQRFDIELAKALDDTDLLIAIIGPRWHDLLKARAQTGERDYVREEIAEAIRRRIPVVPIRVGREGSMPALPRPEELPEDICELVLYQKHDVAHERFGRDIAELNEAILALRKTTGGGQQSAPQPWGKLLAAVAGLSLLVGAGSYAGGWWGKPDVPLPQPTVSSTAAVEAERKRIADLQAEIERRDAELAKAAIERQQVEAEATKLRTAAEARRKADEDVRAKTIAEAEAKRKAEEAERQRLAALKVEEDRQRAAAEAKRKAEEEAARRIPQPGQTFRDCNDGCPEMVVLPPGSFTMGSTELDAEKPTRTVTIRRPFAVGKFEVTFAEWQACVSGGGCMSNPTPSDEGWGKGRRPVINVSWDDAKQYVTWLSAKTGHSYRLLSEAEWEYAARAGGTGRWTFGDDVRRLGDFGWYSANRTQPVGGKTANKFGLHDMHGNVWEWVEDCWHANYSGAPSDGSAWTIACANRSRRVIRGGSWGFGSDKLESASRSQFASDEWGYNLGFRIGRTFF